MVSQAAAVVNVPGAEVKRSGHPWYGIKCRGHDGPRESAVPAGLVNAAVPCRWTGGVEVEITVGDSLVVIQSGLPRRRADL